jgi:hypothetical protein
MSIPARTGADNSPDSQRARNRNGHDVDTHAVLALQHASERQHIWRAQTV